MPPVQDPRSLLSPADAQAIILLAEAAPQANMREAMRSKDVIERVAAFFNQFYAPPAAPEVQPPAPPVPETPEQVPAGTMPSVDYP